MVVKKVVTMVDWKALLLAGMLAASKVATKVGGKAG